MKSEDVRTCAGRGLWLVILLLGGRAWAGDTYWQHDPAAAGDWFVPANWTAGLPTWEHSAYVNNGGTVQIAAGLAEARKLHLGHAAGASGTLELGGGDMVSGSQYIGHSGAGSFQQTGGINKPCQLLAVGYESGSQGTYELSGGELHGQGYEYVGFEGTGLFTQTGGVHTIDRELGIGGMPGSQGTYVLSGGSLEGQHFIEQSVGLFGDGLFIQTGGINVAGRLYLGRHYGSHGTYELRGGELLSETFQYVGEDAGGLFKQTGGTNTVQGRLWVAVSGCTGAYELHAGQLLASEEVIGNKDLSCLHGTRLFRQTGGTNTAGYVCVRPGARYEYAGGTLDITGGLNVEGELDCAGASVAIDLGDDTLVNLSDGYVLNAGNARLSIGANSLTIYKAGCHPSSLFGAFSTQGLFHEGGQTLVIAPAQGFGGWGEIDDHVECQGTIAANPGGGITLNAGVQVSAAGSVNLGMGGLIVDDEASSIGGGNLSAGKEYVGRYGTGLFTQTGGTNTIEEGLFVGREEGASGTYELSAGQLEGGSRLYIGYYGTGLLSQTGGTNTTRGLTVGYKTGSCGTYELKGGELRSEYNETIGYSGTGHFIQTGGINSADSRIYVGNYGGSSGTYELIGGELRTKDQNVGGDSGTGLFIQTGGMNTASGDLCVARGERSSGTYELSGGELRVLGPQYVGYYGNGLFAQTGGTNAVIAGLYLGHKTGSSGTYTISGGSLSTGGLTVGAAGTGELSITGASADVTVSQSLLFGPNSTFSAVAGSTIHMTGSAFYNSSADPTALGGLASLRLIFEGGGVGFDPVEVAGEDLGPLPAGWTDNFALGTLQLGGANAGRIQLVDDADNQQDGPGNEALYVGWLVLNAGAAIDFNALALYFRNGGLPKQLFAGDANLDGRVDGLDYLTWSSNYGQGGMAWTDADYNGDTVVDGLDYIAWSGNYLRGGPGGEGMPVPEPGAVALILAGACLILTRRRAGLPRLGVRGMLWA